MPIYEYYCPDNHRIYQFFAKTLAQGQRTPRCPDNPAYRMEKIVSSFAVGRGSAGDGGDQGSEAGRTDVPVDGGAFPGGAGEEAKVDAAMHAMEREFAGVDENDPRAMGRMMRRLAEITGEPLAGESEEVVRKLEEGIDPEKLEEQLGVPDDETSKDAGFESAGDSEVKGAAGAPRGYSTPGWRQRRMPERDPQLYDYD